MEPYNICQLPDQLFFLLEANVANIFMVLLLIYIPSLTKRLDLEMFYINLAVAEHNIGSR
jgi:hypothetical protein